MHGERGDAICSARWGRRHDGQICLLLLVRPRFSSPAERRPGAALLPAILSARFHAAARSWVLEAVADGTLTVADIKSGPAATRALALFAGRSDPALPAPRPMVAPGAAGAESQQDLETRMAAAVARMRRR